MCYLFVTFLLISQKYAKKREFTEFRGNHLLFGLMVCSFVRETRGRLDGGAHSTSSISFLLFTF